MYGVTMEFTLLVLVLGFESVLGQMIINTDLGKISGKSFTTRNGKTISGYLGIPFAKPPIGDLRFRAPEPYTDQYDDVLAADTDANMCPQLDDDGKVVGDEDCLYMNIYTPAEFSDSPLPIMVYFHGGGFVKGSSRSDVLGPEYIMDRDVILVTVNYRLGALGFMSTGNADSWGNYGLKDQELALKWIRDNIVNFNGNPDAVTLWGHGAGGASSSYHGMFRAEKGLFKRYIAQSGNANCMWSFQEAPNATNVTIDLGKLVKCPTADSKALVDCLRNVDVKSLVDSESIFNFTYFRIRLWTPTEERGDDPFVTMYPVKKALSFPIINLDSIVGTVKDEGLYWTAELYTNQSFFDEMYSKRDIYMKVLVDMLFDEDVHPYFTDQARKNYFQGLTGDKEQFIKAMTDFITDIAFRYPSVQQANLIYDDDAPGTSYIYEFDYRGSNSKTSDVLGNNKDIGVTHFDDLQYFFPDGDLDESDEKMSNILLDLWTSFAATGKATSDLLPDPNVWTDYIDEQGQGLMIAENSDIKATYMHLAMDTMMQDWASAINTRIYGSYIVAYDAV